MLLWLLTDNLDHVHNWEVVSTNHNDQVKPAGKDYVNVNQCDNKNIHVQTVIYSYAVNVN